MTHSVSQKIPPPQGGWGFLSFFYKRLRIFNQFFTHVLYVPNPIYARLQILLIISNFDEVIPY